MYSTTREVLSLSPPSPIINLGLILIFVTICSIWMLSDNKYYWTKLINSDKWMSCEKKNVIFPLLRVEYLRIYDDVNYILAPVRYISRTNSGNFDGYTNYLMYPWYLRKFRWWILLFLSCTLKRKLTNTKGKCEQM